MEIPSEVDTSSLEGLSRLLRFAVRMRGDPKDDAAINLIEKRLGLQPYYPEFRGALEDYCRALDRLDPDQRFEVICALISQALGDEEKLTNELTEEILDIISGERVVRFSFAPSIPVCLHFARYRKETAKRSYHGYTIRYAGLGEDKALMSCASLFLNLPIYTETGLPWAPDMILDDGEPNFEMPDYEISFPPSISSLENAPQLETSVRAEKLPRAIDRGKYDLESIMLYSLSGSEAPAIVFVTHDFLSSTKQSRRVTRQHLLINQRIRRVSQLRKSHQPKFFIELAKPGYMNDSVHMGSSNGLELPKIRKSSSSRQVSYDEIDGAEHSLLPSRHLATGPAGGKSFVDALINKHEGQRFKLVDLFEVIRPKETKNTPEGTLEIQELRAGNITANGEIEGSLRYTKIRATRKPSLEEQVVKAGDILLTHRGSIGHVAYIAETDPHHIGLWAGQTLFILRERKLTSSSKSKMYCDPRVLFMYLLTPEVREHWKNVSSGTKNPSIPIGEVESLSLPENIILSKKPRRGGSSKNPHPNSSYTGQIISDFEKRQAMLLHIGELQKDMNDGLKRVWDAAWVKQIGQNEG